MRIYIISMMLVFAFTTTGHAEIKTAVIDYEAEGVALKGYLAYDAEIEEKRPGVLVVHEWWGHNEYAQKRARDLAKEGYVAFALDMYGDGKTAEHPEDAGAFAKQSMENMDLYKAKFLAALEVLNQQEQTNPDNTMAIGYCFGGSTVLNMARMGVEVDAVASFHGGLTSSVEIKDGEITTRILVLTGGADTMIPPEQIEQFKEEMTNANAEFEVIVYEGATHSFTNPAADELGEKFGMPIAYNKEADEKSWQAMLEMFESVLE